MLGATGRMGGAITTRLQKAGVAVVLIGRDRQRLDAMSARLGGNPRIVVGGLVSALARLPEDPPGVVVNTVGPFTETARGGPGLSTRHPLRRHRQ